MQREDHQDTFIQQLRAEIYELKKSEEDYYLLQEQLNRLETKYRLLNDQKISNDKEHHVKHDSYIKLIQQTKHQLAVLQDELKYKQTDLKDIDSEGALLKRLCEERNNEIERLRMQRNALMAEDEELKMEDERMDHQNSRLHSEIQSLKGEYEKVQNEVMHATEKNREYEGYLSGLTAETKAFIEDIRTLDDKISSLEEQLEAKGEQVRSVEKQTFDASAATKELEVDIAEVGSQNQKYKGQISHYLKLVQSEIARAGELSRNIQVLDSSLKTIQQQSLEVNQETQQLVSQNVQIADINFRLDLDNENCEKHIELLGTQNQCLMQELDKLTEEDEVVRVMLLRKKGQESRSKEGSVKLSRTSHQSRF